jgi:hypothetical protein
MDSKLLLLVIILSLVPCWNASAQEKTLTGEISAVPLQVDVRGNRAKFNEYRDVRNGVHGHIDLRYDGDRTYLHFQAEDMGYKDQKYELKGGRRGSFRFHFSYDEIPHHFTSGNRAFP